MRTLVIGVALPHVSFDNYSFISAPALSEYQRLIVEPAVVSQAVDEVVSGTAQHRTHVGQVVHSGPSTNEAFSLEELLRMRRREAGWFFARGGLLVCFAHPNVAASPGSDVCGWRRYSWLPSPPGFNYAEHLLPGFGTPGASIVDEEHPFALFLSEFAQRLAYRATIDEHAPNFSDYGGVIARSHGGAVIAAELRIDNGSLVFLPALLKPEADRGAIAQALFACHERWGDRQPAD